MSDEIKGFKKVIYDGITCYVKVNPAFDIPFDTKKCNIVQSICLNCSCENKGGIIFKVPCPYWDVANDPAFDYAK